MQAIPAQQGRFVVWLMMRGLWAPSFASFEKVRQAGAAATPGMPLFSGPAACLLPCGASGCPLLAGTGKHRDQGQALHHGPSKWLSTYQALDPFSHFIPSFFNLTCIGLVPPSNLTRINLVPPTCDPHRPCPSLQPDPHQPCPSNL